MQRFFSYRGLWLVCHAVAFCGLVLLARGEELESPYFVVKGENGYVDGLPLKSVDARIDIVGTIAEVELVQTYANVGTETIEALYVFPGSTRAAVNGLEMRVGDRVVEAVIKEKQEAKRTYEAAKEEGKTASLLEQHRPNVFQMSLANILPGDVVEVTLRYTEWVQREKAEYTFALPLTVGPRFNGEVTGETVAWAENPYLAEADEGRLEVAIEASVRMGMDLEAVLCPTHEARIEFADARTARVSLAGDDRTVGNRDFVLRYQVSGDALKSGVMVSESNGEHYFMAMLEPPQLKQGRRTMPREYLFVLDVSGSMSGFPLDTAKRMMSELAMVLNEEDRFNLLQFAGSSRVLSEVSLAATPENLSVMVEAMTRTRGGGGTELLDALNRAYALPKAEGFSRSMVILTDGYVSVEPEAFDLVRERLDFSNVYACGIGSSPNRHLIEGMARVGRGEPFFVMQPSEAQGVAERFAEYVSEPVLSRMRIQYEGMSVYDVEPEVQPDLLAERPIVVIGKYDGKRRGTIRLTGARGPGQADYMQEIDLAGAKDLGTSRALEYVWARERLRRISDYAGLWGGGERKQEITKLGLKHSLLTAYTSFVAVDRVVRKTDAGEATRVQQPNVLPEGMEVGFSGHSVAVTPEPEMWILLGCLFVGLTWILVRQGR